MIGKTLQLILEEKETNVNELAKKIDVSPQTLYSIIKRDNMKADIDVLLKICVELGVNIERFYGDYYETYFGHNEKADPDGILEKYYALDESDRAEVRGFIQCKMTDEKYQQKKQNLA